MSSKTKKNGKKKKIIFPPMSSLPYNYGIVMRIYPSCEQKQCIKVAEIYKKIMNQRKDFLGKLSLWYIKNHDVIVAEELRSNNLLKNHKLALSIQDSGWRTFLTMLERKAAMYGKTFVIVNPKNTTQTCSLCGHVMSGKEKIGLGVEEWTCSKCGTHHIRDYNAAKNILNKGLQVLAPMS